MAISLSTLSSLEANKTYYIANSTGEITEATAWQKFKCFLGIGDGRAKAAKLVQAVKAALLEEAGKFNDTALNAQINTFERTRSQRFSISGGSIARLAANFAAVNEHDIAVVSAKDPAENIIKQSVDEVRGALNLGEGPLDDIAEVMKRAAKPILENPPMKETGDGRRELDKTALRKQLSEVLDEAETTLGDIAKLQPNGRVRFDKALRDEIFAKLYDGDGRRNNKSANTLGSIADIRYRAVIAENDKYRPGGVSKEEFDSRMKFLVNECGEDPEMLDAIEYSANRFLVKGDSSLRTPEEIKNRVASCKETQKELFEAVKGNLPLTVAAHNLAKGLSGHALPKGLIGKLLEETQTIDLRPFQGLGENSNAMDINQATMALAKAVGSILNKFDALAKLDGQDDLMPVRYFIETAVLQRLPKAALRGISAAISSPIAAKLSCYYIDCGTEMEDLPANNFSRDLKNEIESQMNSLNRYIDELKMNAERILGREKHVPVNLKDARNVPDQQLGKSAIVNDIAKESKVFLAVKRDKFLNKLVNGQSAAANAIRGLFGNLIGNEAYNPPDKAFKAIQGNTRQMINWNVMGEAKKVMSGNLQGTQLFIDLPRNIDVTLVGVGKLSKDFATALDQIAHFVTKDPNAKYDSLDEVAKKKAALVIGFIGQDNEKAVMDGCGLALDAKGDTTALSYSGDQSNDTKKYKLELSNDALLVNLDLTMHRKAVLLKDDVLETDGGITINSSLDFTLPKKEMDRLLKLDIENFDGDPALDEFNFGGENGYNENRVDKAFGKIPEEYRFKDQVCTVNYSVHIEE